MLPVTISLYRRFLAKPIAQKTKTTFVEASDDEEFVESLKATRLWKELSGDTALTVQMATQRIDSIPNSIGEVVDRRLDETTKALGNHFSQEFEKAVRCMQAQISGLEEKALGARRFAGDPAAAQAKGVESRKVNQIVNILEEQVNGPSLVAKATELGDFLASVGQPELADWLAENQDAVTKVERRIRANPQLAARLQQYQQRFAGGSAPSGGLEL